MSSLVTFNSEFESVFVFRKLIQSDQKDIQVKAKRNRKKNQEKIIMNLIFQLLKDERREPTSKCYSMNNLYWYYRSVVFDFRQRLVFQFSFRHFDKRFDSSFGSHRCEVFLQENHLLLHRQFDQADNSLVKKNKTRHNHLNFMNFSFTLGFSR